MLSLFTEWNRVGPARYGVYDVTDFIDAHPGAELYDFGRAADATDMFEMAAHSDEAVRRLRTLAVRGLESLPYPSDLEALRKRSERRRGEHTAEVCRHFAVAMALVLLLRCAYLDCGAACRSVGVNVRCSTDVYETLSRIPMVSVLCVALYASSFIWKLTKAGGLVSAEKLTKWAAA